MAGALAAACPLQAQEWVSPAEAAAGQDLIYRGRFSAAHLYFARLADERPRDPTGPTFAASALIWWGKAREEDAFLADSIDALLAEGAARAELVIREAADDSTRSRGYFWLGSAVGYRARQAELLGKWWRAAREAGRMRSALESAIAYDSTCVDCLLGLAAYEYGLARSGALARLVARIIGLGGGDVDHAMVMFRRVVTEGDLARVEGRWIYANALLREGEGDASLREEGLRMVGQLADEYPENPIFRRLVGWPSEAR